jgi:cell wall-associated NlpC family hydrolase
MVRTAIASPRRCLPVAPFPPLLFPVIVLLVLGCAGCTPKKVNFSEVPSGSSPRVRKPGQTVPAESPARKPPSTGPSESDQSAETPAAGSFADQVVSLVHQQLGKMYEWGAEGPDRFDCSGLAYFVYGKLGISMPRVSSRQAETGREIPRNQLQRGDLLYFDTEGKGVDHVGIYIGRQTFIHAPRKGMPVRKDSLKNGWWKQKYRGARRLKG